MQVCRKYVFIYTVAQHGNWTVDIDNLKEKYYYQNFINATLLITFFSISIKF